jgi:hypothetical protein
MAPVPLINLTIQHHQTRKRPDTASKQRSMKSRLSSARWFEVEWATDRNRVRFEGAGFWIEMWVDTLAVHVTGDAPILGRLLGAVPLGPQFAPPDPALIPVSTAPTRDAVADLDGRTLPSGAPGRWATGMGEKDRTGLLPQPDWVRHASH